MERRGQDRRRRAARVRFVFLLSCLVLAAVVLPFVASAENPYTTTSPRSDTARDIQGIYKLIFWMALVVFVGVQAGIVYTVLRYRRRSETDARPEQVHGNKTLEIAWTILPAIVLLIIFIPTVRTMYTQEGEARDGEVEVEVYAKQWWWEVHYTKPETVAGVITANEIHVPQGKKILFKLYSNNVIHSFWVPQLAGKVDTIPGHENRLSFTPEVPGVYYGQCAEFCGEQHAWMKFQVIVEPQEQFDAWIAAWKAGPTQLSAQIAGTGDVAEAPAAFGLCLQCHRINGTNLNVAPVGLEEDAGTADRPGSAKTAGPNLTLFGCRTTIGAGILDNTPENLARWLRDPGAVKSGNYMATVIKKGTLNEDQITQIVGYLESLRPEGGCPTVTGENVPERVASPAANQTAVASAEAAALASQATAAANASATAAAPPAAPTQAGPAGAQLPSSVDVGMYDLYFDPNAITIPANMDVTVNLTNNGAAVHTFDIDQLNIHSGDVQPGATTTVTITAPPGTYQYYCATPGHKEAGMVGTLTVQ